MNHEQWKLWKPLRKEVSESLLVRYGVAVLLPIAAVAILLVRPGIADTPSLVFLGAIVLVAANGGLAPAFLSIALSASLLRFAFVIPNLSLHYGSDSEGLERLAGFVLIALVSSSFVASLRRTRNHLQDSEERYRMLAETASDAIIVIDDKGEILYVNPVAERTFGRPAEDLLSLNLACLLPDHGHQARLDEMKRRLDSRQKAVAVQLPGLRESGERLLVEMTLGSSQHRGRDLFTAVIRDITGKKR